MKGCLLLDVRMPGMDGLELLDHMRDRGIRIPVIFVTAFGNIPMALAASLLAAGDSPQAVQRAIASNVFRPSSILSSGYWPTVSICGSSLSLPQVSRPPR